MGHDVAIHRDYYRLPEHTVELAKVSKLLMALDSGNLVANSGKSLSDVDVEEELNGGYEH